jgi:hypothetical protein
MIQHLIERFQAWRRWRAMWRKPLHDPRPKVRGLNT